MPVFDTPITTDDSGLGKILNQNLPVALYFYDSRRGSNGAVDDAFKREAKQNSGTLLVARIDVSSNSKIHSEYGSLPTPALITLSKVGSERQVTSQAGNVQPSDVVAHINYLLGKGPKPAEKTVSSNGASYTNGSSKSEAGKTQAVTDATFRDVVLNSKEPVLVDFWAPWCGPCRAIAPTLEQMAQTYAGRVKVVKLNTDENPRVGNQYMIQSIPTFIVFKGGQPIDRRSGASPQILRSMFDNALKA